MTPSPRPSLPHKRFLSALPPCPPLVAALFAADALMVLLAASRFLAGGEGGAWDLVRLGLESNVPTWYSSGQLLLIAVVLVPLVARDVRRRDPRTWPLVLIPAFFLLLSLDEEAMLHERLGDWFKAEVGVGEGLRTGPWMFVYVPLVGVLFLAVVRAGWPYLRGRRGACWLLGTGVVAFAVAAVGFEFAANFVPAGSLAQKGLGFVEEIGEMIAATLLMWGALAVLRHEGVGVAMGDRRRPEPRPARGQAPHPPRRSRSRTSYSAGVTRPTASRLG